MAELDFSEHKLKAIRKKCSGVVEIKANTCIHPIIQLIYRSDSSPFRSKHLFLSNDGAESCSLRSTTAFDQVLFPVPRLPETCRALK